LANPNAFSVPMTFCVVVIIVVVVVVVVSSVVQ